MTPLTPPQTIGPFFAYCLTSSDYGQKLITSNRVQAGNERQVLIKGSIYDGNGAPVTDAMLEIWQIDTQSRLPKDLHDTNTSFNGFARSGTDVQGSYQFETVKPGQSLDLNNVLQAPHINVVVFARGLISHLFTRIYFSDENCNETDPTLSSIKDVRRRASIIATRASESDQCTTYIFDIHLQGAFETIFFRWNESILINNQEDQ